MMITEFIYLAPKACICDGHSLEFKREPVPVVRDPLAISHKSVSATGLFCYWQHDSLSEIGTSCNQNKCLSVTTLDTTIVFEIITF